MKDGAEFAKRFRAFYSKLKRGAGTGERREPLPIIEELIVAILARETTEPQAVAAYRRLIENVVDLNELRVTTPREMADFVGAGFPECAEKAEEITSVLSDIVVREGRLDLAALKQKKVREAREYLETLGGASPFAAAWVLSRCLGGHAVPVDQALIRALKADELVSADAELPEIQAFLERVVSSADARRYPSLLREYALRRTKSSKRAGESAGPTKASREAGTRSVGASATERRPAAVKTPTKRTATKRTATKRKTPAKR
jgi:endonuclease III